VRRYRDLLYALPPLCLPPPDWTAIFDGGELALPAGLGVLRLTSSARTPRLSPALCVRFRRGGESLRLAGGAHTRELRTLLQEKGIPPWQRARLPLLFDGTGALIAVADLWLSDAGSRLFAQHDAHLQWLDVNHPVQIDLDEAVR
jgi:tRNA(Ile)-lysidine synthase